MGRLRGHARRSPARPGSGARAAGTDPYSLRLPGAGPGLHQGVRRRGGRRARTDHERQETERVIARLLEQAQSMGTVRADLTVADFRLLIAAHHGVVLAAGPDVAADS
ncbi:hypothetical protein [Micromonospora sp. DH14]|uniref:SbtR family transcriptional regulator n=1 Tax=Micromonospora sp. DH14 TaxID=3040120 RepID=UPI00326195B0